MCHARSRLEVLVVEDDCANSEAIREIIEDRDVYNVLIVNNKEEAIKTFKPNHFVISFIDLNLQGNINNGIELIKKIREIDNNIVIVIVSAHPEYIFNKILVRSVDDFIKKPIDVDFFSSKLFFWSAQYERRMKESMKHEMLESKISSYESRLERIRNIDIEIEQLSEKLEASIPGEDSWLSLRAC